MSLLFLYLSSGCEVEPENRREIHQEKEDLRSEGDGVRIMTSGLGSVNEVKIMSVQREKNMHIHVRRNINVVQLKREKESEHALAATFPSR